MLKMLSYEYVLRGKINQRDGSHRFIYLIAYRCLQVSTGAYRRPDNTESGFIVEI